VVAINSTMIKNINFIVPDTKVLQEFNEIITSIFSKLRHNSLEITSLINSRDTLLSKLMKEGVRMGEF
jgi:restriction endonuclease S subunit